MKVEPIFIGQSLVAIKTMREAGMTDGQIACVLQDVRASAITEERLRVNRVLSANPPTHPIWTDMLAAVEDVKGD